MESPVLMLPSGGRWLRYARRTRSDARRSRGPRYATIAAMTATSTGVATKRPRAVATAQPSVLAQLAAALASRRIRVIDLTQTLTPDFPQIAHYPR